MIKTRPATKRRKSRSNMEPATFDQITQIIDLLIGIKSCLSWVLGVLAAITTCVFAIAAKTTIWDK